MAGCEHLWEMTNVRFGFIVFERCAHCASVRTYFSSQDTWDQYREGACTWGITENVQSLMFDLQCTRCGRLESFSELMGLLACTECMQECEVVRLQEELRADRTWIVVAFGHLPEAKTRPIPEQKLAILSDHFNQRRDTARSKVKVVSMHLIKDISVCTGEFVHDVGMLSLEPVVARKYLL